MDDPPYRRILSPNLGALHHVRCAELSVLHDGLAGMCTAAGAISADPGGGRRTRVREHVLRDTVGTIRVHEENQTARAGAIWLCLRKAVWNHQQPIRSQSAREHTDYAQRSPGDEIG